MSGLGNMEEEKVQESRISMMIVGAQKAGTTSLLRYLGQSSGLRL